jgi:hypothetical protein
VSANGASKGRDTLSPLTLTIAAIASGIAAIVTSHFLGKGGTVLTAAMTPVIVSLVKEGLQRPIQSDLVRRPVQRMASTRTEHREPAYARTGAPPRFEEEPHAPGPPGNGAPPTGYGPVRTYGGSSRPRWHLRAAIVTGVLAFAIAAIVLTVPELVFGGSVAGKGRTTFFSTHASKSHKSSSESDQQKTSTDSTNTDTNEQATPPAQQQGTDTTTQPDQQTPPAQQAPQQGGTPAPQQAPAPSAPPASSP